MIYSNLDIETNIEVKLLSIVFENYYFCFFISICFFIKSNYNNYDFILDSFNLDCLHHLQ